MKAALEWKTDATIGESDSPYISCSSHEFSFQRMAFAKSADTEHTEAQHMPLFVNPFHDSIVSRGPHEARRLTELHFEVVRFRIKPDFYFFGHIVSPVLS